MSWKWQRDTAMLCAAGIVLGTMTLEAAPAAKSAAAETTPATVQNAPEKITAMLKDWTKMVAEPEKLTDPDVAPKGVELFRLLYTKPYFEDVQKAQSARERITFQVDSKISARIDHLDLILIPKFSDFKLQAALKKSKPEDVKNPGGVTFYRQYGLSWAYSSTETHCVTLYMGEDSGFYYFGRGNVSLLDEIARRLNLQNGFDRITEFARLLSVEDWGMMTSTYCTLQLVSIGDDAIPAVEESLDRCLVQDLVPMAQVMTLYEINSNMSQKALRKLLREENPHVRDALFSVIRLAKVKKEMKPFYLTLLEKRICMEEMAFAIRKFQWEKDSLPVYRKIIARPYSFNEYAFALPEYTRLTLPAGSKGTVHQQCVLQIKRMLVHSGDIPKSVKYLDLDENSGSKAAKYIKEDRARVKPFEDMLVQAPEKDMSVLSALSLCMFDAPPEIRGVSPQFIQRVRKSGMNVLSQLPADAVDRALRTLIKYNQNEDERALLKGIYKQYQAKRI